MPINIQREFASIGLSSGGGVFAPSPVPSGRLEASQAIGGATMRRFDVLADAIDTQTRALVNRGQALQQAGETVRLSSERMRQTFARIEEQREQRRQRHVAQTKEIQFLRDSANILAEAEEQSGPSGAGLEQRVREAQGKRIAELLSDVPDEDFRTALSGRLDLIAVRNEINARTTETRKERAFLLGELNKRAAAYHAQALQFRGSLQENLMQVMIADYRDAVAEGLLTPAEGEKKIAAFRAAVAEGTFNADVASDPMRAAQRLEAGEYDVLLPDESSRVVLGEKIKDAVTRRQRTERIERERAAQRVYQERVSSLELGVDRGEIGVAEIDQALKAGSIRPRDAVRIRKTAQRTESARAEEERLVFKASAAMAGNLVLDPHSKEDRKAVDLHYLHVFTQTMKGPDKERRHIDYVVSVGIVPTALRSKLSAHLLNGTVQQKVQAADFMDRLGERKPSLLEDFAEKERRLGALLTRLVGAGMDPDKAVVQAAEAIFKFDDFERQRRLREIRAEKHETNYRTWIHDAFPDLTNFLGLGGEDPGVAVLDDMAVLYREHYLATGDMETAAKLARQDIKAVWGVTYIGGRRLVRYAPETVYGNFILPDELKMQLMTDVTKLEVAKAREAGREIDEDDVMDDLKGKLRLIADRQTPHEYHPVTGAFWPAYAVFKNGQPLLDKNGVPLRWRPEVKKLRSDIQRKIDHAELQRKTRADFMKHRWARIAEAKAKIQHREGY